MIAALGIDTGALRRNAERLATLVEPARFAAVVKANAYGHGLVAVARALQGVADMFCVYRGDEALALREAGVAEPILVLGPIAPRELAGVAAARAAITLWDEGTFARDAARVARGSGEPFAVHAKVDTGVARLGLPPERAADAIARYAREPAFALRGVYTHLAAAEELESAFTLDQLARFESALQPLEGALRAGGVVRHAAASAAAMLFPALRLDLVRVGIALYGIWPSPETRAAADPAIALEPALSWTSEVVVVREVDAGCPVGYGCTFTTNRPSRIGVLPVGYAEGVPRALSNRGEVLVEGRRVPLVGRICMNMCFVDLTAVPQARPGSKVTFIGRDGEEAIDANDLGERANTIGYEIVARLPDAIPRTYRETPSSAAMASAKSSVPS